AFLDRLTADWTDVVLADFHPLISFTIDAASFGPIPSISVSSASDAVRKSQGVANLPAIFAPRSNPTPLISPAMRCTRVGAVSRARAPRGRIPQNWCRLRCSCQSVGDHPYRAAIH